MSFTPTPRSGPACPKKTKIFLPTFATSSAHGCSSHAPSCFSAWARRALRVALVVGMEWTEGAYSSTVVVSPEKFPDPELDQPVPAQNGEAKAVLAGGCFWCVEAVYKQLDAVRSVVSGYAGGSAESADYETGSSGRN